MFKGVLQDISAVRDSLSAVSELITEGSFEVSKEGMTLIAMDPASVAMVILKVLPSAFLEYDVDTKQSLTVNLGNFVTVLKRARASDTITFDLTENKLKVKMVGDFKRSFSLPLLDTPTTDQNVPTLDFKGKVELDPNALKDGIKDASMVSDCVIFEANSDAFKIKSFGDTSETDMELAKDSPSLNSLQVEGDLKSKYSIDYLDKILKGTKAADKIDLNFSTDYPLRINCTAVNKLQLSFILAPRVDTE